MQMFIFLPHMILFLNFFLIHRGITRVAIGDESQERKWTKSFFLFQEKELSESYDNIVWKDSMYTLLAIN